MQTVSWIFQLSVSVGPCQESEIKMNFSLSRYPEILHSFSIRMDEL